MSLPYSILKWVQGVRAGLFDARDPTVLDRLEREAKESWEGALVALHAPIAPLSWETRAILPGTVQQTTRQPLIFPRPVEIVGLFPAVIPVSIAPGLRTATPLDIDISIDVNSVDYLTAGQGVSTSAGGTAGNFVTLASVGVQVPRLHMTKLTAPKPDMGMTFHWKLPAAVGAAIYNDSFISVAVYARYLP